MACVILFEMRNITRPVMLSKVLGGRSSGNDALAGYRSVTGADPGGNSAHRIFSNDVDLFEDLITQTLTTKFCKRSSAALQAHRQCITRVIENKAHLVIVKLLSMAVWSWWCTDHRIGWQPSLPRWHSIYEAKPKPKEVY